LPENSPVSIAGISTAVVQRCRPATAAVALVAFATTERRSSVPVVWRRCLTVAVSVVEVVAAEPIVVERQRCVGGV